MPNTTIAAIPVPAYTAVPDVPADLNAMALQIEKFIIPRFASEAARDAAITVPVDGMYCYVTGIGLMERKTTWVRLYATYESTGSLSFASNWTSNVSQPVKITRVGDTVHIEGLANAAAAATTSTNNIIGTIPTGFRPTVTRAIAAHANPGPILLSVANSGNIIISSLYGLTNVPAGGFVYLDSLTYRI